MEPVDSKVCNKCGWKGDTSELACPRCHEKLQSQYTVRALGVLLVMLGAFLVVMMGSCIRLLWNVVDQTGNRITTGYTGTKNQMLMSFGIMGAVFVFGLVAAITGLDQTINARRNQTLTYIALLVSGALYVGAELFIMFF